MTKVVKNVQGQDGDGGRTDIQERDNQRQTENDIAERDSQKYGQRWSESKSNVQGRIERDRAIGDWQRRTEYCTVASLEMQGESTGSVYII